jgi:hypothetical protein
MALAQRTALHRHQWLMDLIGGRPPLGPNALRNLDRALAVIDPLGLGTETALNVLSAIGPYVVGAVLRALTGSKVPHPDEEMLAQMARTKRSRSSSRTWSRSGPPAASRSSSGCSTRASTPMRRSRTHGSSPAWTACSTASPAGCRRGIDTP